MKVTLPEIQITDYTISSDADLLLILSPVDPPENVVDPMTDFASWVWTAKGKTDLAISPPVVTFTVTPSLVDGVPTLTVEAAQASLAALFTGNTDLKKKLLVNMVYVRPPSTKMLPGGKLEIHVTRGTNS